MHLDEDTLTSRMRRRSQTVFTDFSSIHLPDFSHVPSQISPSEKGYLHWLISEGYTGKGAIVEVGTWLGSSSVHLAQGLRDSGCPGKLYCYDRYIWAGEVHNLKSGLDLEENADFRPYFEKNVEPFKDIIETTTTDFRDIQWSGDPIEILFLDAPKNSVGFHATFSAFAQYLVPGESIVALQDYLHPPSYALALCVQHLGEKMELRHVVHYGGTVSFQVKAEIQASDYAIEDLKFLRMTRNEVMEAWEAILSPLPAATRERFSTAKAMHLFDNGHVADACAVLADLDVDEYMQSKWRSWRKVEAMVSQYGPLIDVFNGRF